jgi:hypothetical protein
MKDRRRFASSIHESFADVALLMLATFIFLLVMILINTRLGQEYELPRIRAELVEMKNELDKAYADRQRLLEDLGEMVGMTTEAQVERVLESFNVGSGEGRKDFDLFIQGLQHLPGEDLHLVIDATGSMHGLSSFLIPILRVIVNRSEKHVSAITWFTNERAETYTGTLGEMFDQLMIGAPFSGADETIGDAFRKAARNAPAPGAYLLLGDEPSDDRIYYSEIPSPVFTIPIGRFPATLWEYQKLADNTGGRMMRIELR